MGFGGLAVYLTRYQQYGNRVEMSHGQAGSRVRNTRTRRYAADTDAAGRSRVAIGHERRGLFVPHEDVLDLRMFVEGVVNCCGMCAGYPEDNFHTPSRKTFDQKLSACHPYRLMRRRIV